MKVSAPYNFVPLSGIVCKAEDLSPELAEKPAQDIPETDSRSGVLPFKIICETHLLVGDGGEERNFVKAPDKNGKPMIPGSSLRGMIRNVMEIASFARMQFVDDQRVGVRDLGARLDYRSRLTAGSHGSGYAPKARAGFLKIDQGCLRLYRCKFARIEHEDLNALAPGFWNAVMRCARNRDQNERVAEKVEALFSKFSEKKKNKLNRSLWVQDEPCCHQYSVRLCFRRAARDEVRASEIRGTNEIANVSEKEGRLVFTGLPGSRKHMEFFFFDKEKEGAKVSDDTWKRFIAVHEEAEKESETWKWRKKQLFSGDEIPVFWLPNEDDKPAHIGLAMMFKIAADNSIGDMIDHSSRDHRDDTILDLPTRIFGQVADNKDGQASGFRTRVSFGWAELVGSVPSSEEYRVIAARPKPSFVACYVRQRDFLNTRGEILLEKTEYRSYMNRSKNGLVKEKLRGWKRYPVRPEVILENVPEETTTTSVLRPLCGTLDEPFEFRGKIRYHNLHPIELGALVWALTWGGNDKLRHSLGMGRPYGWGQVKIVLEKDFEDERKRFTDAMEDAMRGRCPSGWADSLQMRQLRAMANPEVGTRERNKEMLKQMRLDPHGENQFEEAKRDFGVLPEYDAESVLPFVEGED